MLEEYVKMMNKFCNKYRYIYIYGAGKYARYILELLQNNSLTIEGCVVSCKHENIIDDIIMLDICEIPYEPKECGVILALSEKYHLEVVDRLKWYKFFNIFSFSNEVMKTIINEMDSFSLKLVNEYRIVNRMRRIDDRESILIVRLDGIGDLVLTTPFVRELRYNHPSAYITLVTTPVAANLYEVCPYIDEVIAYDWQKVRRYTLRRRLLFIKKFVEKKLNKKNYSIAIIPRWDVDYYDASFITYISGAKRRVAYSENVNEYKATVNKYYDALFTELYDEGGVKHEVLRNMDLLRWMDGKAGDSKLELWENKDDKIKIDTILENHSCKNKTVVLIGVSASCVEKKWDYHKYLEVINKVQDLNLKFILIGGDEDREIASNITCECDTLDLVGRLTLREVVALSRHADLYLGNDTGVMHIAAACGIKILEISSYPKNGNDSHIIERFSPWGVTWDVLRPNAGENINSITVDCCVQKLRENLDNNR